MSDAVDKMTDEEIAKWQEELYAHEEQAGGVFTGPVIIEEEKMERIKAFLADDYLEKLHAKVEARKKEIVQEIAVTKDPRKKERLQWDLTLLSGFSK